jgi:hypothetical protein
MEGSGAGIHCDRMSRSHHRSEFTLKVPCLRASRQPPGPKNINDFGDFFFSYIGDMEWKHSLIPQLP